MAAYTELEWSIGIQAPAADTEVYEFRVYDGATPLNTYALTPLLTVAAAAVAYDETDRSITITATVTVADQADFKETLVSVTVAATVTVGDDLTLGPGVATVAQEGFRWRNDDGDEDAATWMVAQDAHTTLAIGQPARLRVLLDATGIPAPSTYVAYYKKTTDSTWLPVPVGPVNEQFRYYRWLVTKRRSSTAMFQASELSIYVGAVRQFPTVLTYAGPGVANEPTEGVAKLVDTFNSKLLIHSLSSDTTELPIVFDFGGSPIAADTYSWLTADDATDRDAVSWVIQGSNDGVLFVTLDSQTNYATTTSRLTEVGPFSLTPPNNPLYVATSTYITAGGEPTTALLTPPAGKTTADFSVGRMWDDENSVDVITIGAAPAWAPTDLALIGWWDASDAASITASGGAVSQWADKSGNGLHFSQATGGSQPTTGVLSLNGLNTISFDGTADQLTYDAGSDALDLNPVNIYVVARFIAPTFSEYHGLVAGRNSAGSNSINFINGSAYDHHKVSVWYNTGSTGTAYITAGGAWSLFRVSLNGTAAALKVDSAEQTATLSSAPNLLRFLRVGADLNTGIPPTTSKYTDMDIAEMFISTDSDDTEAFNYLNTKWGLTDAGTVVFTDDFTGTNGAAWNSTNWPIQRDGTIDIQSNAGRITGGHAVAMTGVSVTDFELVGKGIWPNLSGAYNEIGWRMGSNLSSGNPGSGYIIQITGGGAVQFFVVDAGSGYSMQASATDSALDAGGAFWFRVRVVGMNHKIRWWADGAGEPTTWQINVAESTWSTGRVFLANWNTTTLSWDDFTLKSIP